MNYGEANVLASTSLRALHVNRNLSITDNKEAKRDLSPLLQKLLQLFLSFSSLVMYNERIYTYENHNNNDNKKTRKNDRV